MTSASLAGLRLAPLLPQWLLVALALAGLVVLALAAWRRARGAAWRGVAFAILLVWLANPQLLAELRAALPDIGLLVVDDSASMQVGNRAALAQAARSALLGQVAARPDLQWRSVVVPEAGSGGTHLFAAIDRALADIPRDRLAGIIAITDGQVHDAPAAAPAAPFNVLIPAAAGETDRVLRVLAAPAFGLVGHDVTLRIEIDDLGVAHPPPDVALTIRRDGDAPQTRAVAVGVAQNIVVPITRAGPVVIALRASPLAGAVSDRNASAVVQIEGVRDRLSVLLVSGEPNPGERAWRRLLKADPAVDLVHFTILRPPEKDDGTPLNQLALIAFPVRELFLEKIRQFDLIILDRFANRGILPQLYLRNIADYVQGGGALLLTTGPEYVGPTSLAATALQPVLPALPAGSATDGADSGLANSRTTDADTDAAEGAGPGAASGVLVGAFRPQLTALGTRHPVTAELPGASGWGDWYRAIVALPRPDAQVLMRGPDRTPLLVLDRVGQGRVAILLSDQIWLWARDHDGGGPQAELLRRMAHWLMREPQLEENALTARVRDGRLSVFRRSVDPGPPPPLRVTDPAGTTRIVPWQDTPGTAQPGLAQAVIGAAAPGLWVVTDGTRTAYAASGAANALEFADLRASAERLAPIARASGGGVHWLVPGGVPALRRVPPGQAASGADWVGLRANHAYRVTGASETRLLPGWLALLAALGAIALGWWREGR